VSFVLTFLRFLIIALWLLVVGRALWSWTDPRFSSPVGRFLYQMTEPLLAPIRRVIPQTGAVDISPLVLIVLLTILLRLMVA
jgi:YggT family protein